MRTAQFFSFLFLILFGFTAFVLLFHPNNAQAVAGHVVISEIQIAGVSSPTDEFVELYNPTGVDVNLNNWELAKKTASGIENVLVATMSGTIKSHGFFLITPQSGYTGTTSADIKYSTTNSISNDNTIILYNDSGTTINDEVGFGSATASETATTINPASGKSKERKANSLSTKTTMEIGGVDEFEGNGQDTDNNANDFVLRDIPQPQNSFSPVEPAIVIPSETPTTTPTGTSTPTPSESPTPTETPTAIPTQTPTPSETPAPTEALTPTPSPTVTLTITPTPTGIIHRFPFSTFTLVCSWNFKTFSIFGSHFVMPYIRCVLEKS